MKKIIMLIILAVIVVSCELVSPSYWDRVSKSRRESGEECYRTSSGYFYCEDKDGNRY